MSARLSQDRSGLFHLFTDNARVKILAEFVENPEEYYNNSQIARDADVSRGSWYEHRDALLEIGIIREDGGKYTLDTDHSMAPLVQSIHRYRGSGQND